MRIWFCIIALIFARVLHAQVAGSIVDPAAPVINPLDPNGDGLVTSTGFPFAGPNDYNEFEISFIPLQQFQPEPGTDNQISPGCEFYELVSDANSNAYPAYYYFSNPDGIADNGDELIYFRFRVARHSNGSTAFSILIDTDYRFGFSGPEADPNAVAGNPGFELEVAVFNNTGISGGVRVFNTDGSSSAAIVNYQASIASHYQLAYALNNDPACTQKPVFVDMYVPFSALGISSSLQIRMAAAANESIGSSLGGGATDIGGVDGNLLPGDDDQFVALISGFAPILVARPADQAPLAVDATVSLNENSPAGTIVYKALASDMNGDILTWSIEGGNIGNTFSIDPATGALTVNNAVSLDAERYPTFVLLLRASDGSLYDNSIITVQVIDINEPPFLADAAGFVDEHSPVGFVVHKLDAKDPDLNARLNYSILGGNDNGIFNINASTGEITVADAALLNFETTETHTLLVRVSDGSFSDDGVLTITVSDVNEPPTINAATVVIDENPASGLVVAMADASDPDAGTVLQYSITGGNTSSAFAINNFTGEISVADPSMVNFETEPVFLLSVRASDGSLFGESVMTINLRNVNEAPVVQPASLNLESTFREGDVVHAVIASDPDADDMLIFSFEEVSDGSLFSIDELTGEITIADITRIGSSALFAHMMVVATDKSGLTGRARIELTIKRKLERSDIIPHRGFSPNGDEQNDFWLIENIEAFPGSFVRVFDRWGLLVYEEAGYNNSDAAWYGEVHGTIPREENTYFYIIKAMDFEPITGYLIVKP